ncbi:MAG: Txe/YoeB family addiction module toxin [Thermoanaerobaculia bacterium]
MTSGWQVVFTRQAARDATKISKSGLRPKVERLLDLLSSDPLATPPPVEKLVGDLAGAFSRRINIQHRLIYEVFSDIRTVRVLRMWSHYE